MQVGVYRKTPGEKERIAFDVTHALAAGDSPLSATCTAYDSANADVSATLLDGDAQISAGSVYQFVKGGTPGAVYYVVVSLTTAQGAVVQDSVRVEVVASPPSSGDPILDFGNPPELSAIRNAMLYYGKYAIVNSTDFAQRYIYACQAFLDVAENEITHGSESVKKESVGVQSNIDRADRWLKQRTVSPRVRHLSVRNFR